MKPILFALTFLVLTVARPAHAVEEALLGAWIGAVVVGAATVLCTAKVVGDAYEGWCEGQGGVYERSDKGSPGRPGSGYACLLDAEATTSDVERGSIDECVWLVLP